MHAFTEGEEMKRKSLFLASVILGFSFLSSCIDLELSWWDTEGPYPPSPYENESAYIRCDDAWGSTFSGLIARQPDGLYLVNLLELGANPIALPYDCQVLTVPFDCCTPVSFDGEDLFQQLSLTIICGLPNPCFPPD